VRHQCSEFGDTTIAADPRVHHIASRTYLAIRSGTEVKAGVKEIMSWAALLKARADELTSTQGEVNAVWLGNGGTAQLVHPDAFRAFSLLPNDRLGR